MKRIMSLILCVCLLSGAFGATAKAEDMQKKYLQISVNETVKMYDCLYVNEVIYCSAESMAEITGYQVTKIDNKLVYDFFREKNIDEDNWYEEVQTSVQVTVNESKGKADVKAMGESYDVEYYMVEDHLFLPLEKFLYLLHAEWSVIDDIVYVTPMPLTILDFLAIHGTDLAQTASTSEDVLIDTGWLFSDNRWGQSVYSAVADIFTDFDGKIFMLWWPGEGHVKTAECYENAILQLAQEDKEFIGEDVQTSAMERIADSTFYLDNAYLNKIQNIISVPENIDDIVKSVPDAVAVLEDMGLDNKGLKTTAKKINMGEIDTSFLNTPELGSKVRMLGDMADGLAILQCIWNAYNTANRVEGWNEEYLEQLRVLAEYQNPGWINKNVEGYVKSSAQRLLASYDNPDQAAKEEALQSTIGLFLSTTFEESPFGKAFSIMGALGESYGTFDVETEETYDIYSELSVVTFSIKTEQLVRELFKYEDLLTTTNQLTDEKIEEFRNQLMLYLRLNLRNKARLYNINVKGNEDKNWINSDGAKQLYNEIVNVYSMLAELIETKDYDNLITLDGNLDDIHSLSISEKALLSERSIDAADYYGKWNEFIALKEMRSSDSLTYISDTLRLNFIGKDQKDFILSNSGDNMVSVYGIKIGDTYQSALETISGKKLSIESYNKQNTDKGIYIWDATGDNNVILIQFTVDSNGIIKEWSVINWPEGQSAAYYMSVLRSAYEKGLSKFESWQSAYLQFIEADYYENNNANMKAYQLIYINDDDIPELCIEYGSTAGGSKIVSYDGKQIFFQHLYTSGLSYLERSNLFKDSGGHMDVYYDKIYSIRDGKFIVSASGEYGAEDNSNVQVDSNGLPIYNYYWNDELTSESEYQNQLAKSFDLANEISPYGKYDTSTGLYSGFYDFLDIPMQIVSQ